MVFSIRSCVLEKRVVVDTVLARESLRTAAASLANAKGVL